MDPITSAPVLSWAPADDPEAATLSGIQQRELATMNPDDHVPYGLRQDIEFVLLRLAGVVAACGALQRLDAETGEIKRMYVVPEARGRGLSRLVLTAIEERAVERGLGRLRLETSLAFAAAVALYRSAGYVAIPAFGPYIGDPISYCMERAIIRDDQWVREA